MPILESLGTLLVLAAIWFWYDTIKARDAGINAARQACAGHGVQLLDDTVVLKKLRPGRDDEGRVCLERVFSFEYSDTGDNRRRGSITTLGSEVTEVYTGPTLLKDIVEIQ